MGTRNGRAALCPVVVPVLALGVQRGFPGGAGGSTAAGDGAGQVNPRHEWLERPSSALRPPMQTILRMRVLMHVHPQRIFDDRRSVVKGE
jgi:hypothetical protein